MVKVGQIYKNKKTGILAVVSAIGSKEFFIIAQDGSAARLPIQNIEMLNIFYTIVAEYPTWKQAVNSPEFKWWQYDN